MKKILIALTVLLTCYTGAYAQQAETINKNATTTKTTTQRHKDGSVTRKTTTKTTASNIPADPNATNGTRFPTGTYANPTGTQPDYNATKRSQGGASATSTMASDATK